jgi:ABC-type multidrug transport system fused ATPase/permease subunit
MALLRVNQLVLLAVDSLFTLGTVVAAGGAAIWRLQDGAIAVGQAVAITLLGVALIEPMSQIGRFFYVGAIGRAAAKDIKTFLGVLAAGDGFVPRRGCTGLVDIRDVSFSYEGGRRALDSVTLRIEPGEVVGLVGPSGAGKSTLAAIVTGLAKPSTGSVDVGGRVAMVSQRPFLFHGSVRDNLLLAAPEASESELRAALEAVELLSIVEERGEGLELELGERGLNLSGGEGQRLTIARMLLTGAPIVVLDEPTSNVDIETEATVRRAVDRLTADKTVVIITHRHSTLAGVDRIVMLDSGRIVGSGCPGTPEGQAILSRMAVTS